MARYLFLLACLPALCAPGAASAFDLDSLKNLDFGKVKALASNVVEAVREVPEEREITIGREVSAALLGAARLIDDPAMQRYVNQVGRWLTLHTERPDLPWRFGVIGTDTVNAFAAPGGHVFVTRGLMRLLEDEAQLAGVLAHEIGHVLRRHHLEAIRKQALRGAAVNLAAIAAGDQGPWLDAAVAAGMNLYAKGLDREDEHEADRIGVVLAARAGYAPWGLAEVLARLDAHPRDEDVLALMTSTHPPAAERLARLDERIADRFDAYPPGVTGRARFRGHVPAAEP